MGCFLDPCAAMRAPARFPLSVDCCLSVFRSIFPPEEGSSNFWQPGAATPRKFWSQPQGVTFITPSSPPVALTRRRSQVDYCLLFFLCFPLPGRGGWRSKAAQRRRDAKKSERAISVASSPNADTWRLRPTATADG